MAREFLDGFGDAALGEWTDDRPLAFHLRRRLSVAEQQEIGEAIDRRGTDEGKRRLEAIQHLLPTRAVQMAQAELECSENVQ